MKSIPRRAVRMMKRLDPRRWLYRLRPISWPFYDRYIVEDNTQVTVYTAQPEMFSSYQPVRDLSAPRMQHVAVSVILTARNERDTARQTLASILSQTRLPDEIVVTDTGSNDGTVDVLRELASESAIPIKIILDPGANIACGRNAAIAQARGPVIAVTDFGCEPHDGWLESLVTPFEIDPENQVTAGRYIVANSSARFPFWPALDQIDPQSYLPPGGSIAFTKQAWESIGGYPEWLTLTGEDTYFDLELKRSTGHWAFAPEAVVGWEPPQTARGWWRKAGYWASGDGEIGANASTYQRALRQIGFLVVLPLVLVLAAGASILVNSSLLMILTGVAAAGWLVRLIFRTRRLGYSPFLEAGVRLAMISGYLQGLRRRSAADTRRWKTVRGIVAIFSGVPVDDTGGGARGAQIALELIRRQFLVIFVNYFPKYETGRIDVRIGHPNLLTTRFSKFTPEPFIRQFVHKPFGLLVEHPIPDFLPVIRDLRKLGGRVIYDLIDDWSTSLGARWYTETAEQELIAASDALLATAPALHARLERLSGREVQLLPNAVNLRLFNFRHIYPRPADLPAAEWTVIYIGALWGDWFDWDLLIEVARRHSMARHSMARYPACSVVVIGDYRGQCPQALPNLHFLGLKAQRDLPAYLAHSQVAIIPWKVNAITRATSPLKVYEYLAMHKPVVVPNLPLLSELPFVFCSQDHEAFLQNLAAARQAHVDGEALEHFLAQNSWQARVDSIVDIIS
jgi:hypothetical protein